MQNDGLIHDQISTSLQGLYSMCIACGYALRILFSPRKNHVTNRPIRKKTMINILSASRLLYIYTLYIKYTLSVSIDTYTHR